MIRYITELPSSEWENSFPRPVVLLGSTGSIGVNTLRIIEKHPDLFQVVALAGGRNVERLIEQALRWRPPYLGIQTEEGRKALLPGYEPEILVGPQGYAELASLPEASTVLSAQMGAAGLRATMAAAEAGKVICLANKESLVLAGGMLRETCARTGAVILPVDSEHNAVFQGLRGRNPETVRRIILTASGGPFRGKKRDFLATVTPAQALKHPNWSMGAKITIDSASMMNKGFEMIEAKWRSSKPITSTACRWNASAYWSIRSRWCTRWWSSKTAPSWRRREPRTCVCPSPTASHGRSASTRAFRLWILPVPAP